MQRGPENILKAAGMREGVWLITAIALGAAWGFSAGPIHLPATDTPGLAQLKLLGWLAVAVLCIGIGAMAWVIFRLGPRDDTDEGSLALNSPPAPGTPARSSSAFAGEPEHASAAPDIILPSAASHAHTGPPHAAAAPEIKDPFLAALDYVGHAQATVRIGGILALERWVRQGGDLQPVIGTLTAYVQQWTGREDSENRKVRPGYDVVAALAVLTRLLPSGDPGRNLVDLRRTHLAGLELPDADLSRFHLEYANLSGADLRGANFSGVNFRGADLRGAQLSGAIFVGASLRGADLTGAILSDDEFGPADLSMAGNVSAAQFQHIRYHPGRPPHLPAGMQLAHQSTAMAI